MAKRPLLRAVDVAMQLGLSVATIRRWARDGKLSAMKLGRNVRYRGEVIDEILENGLPRKLTKEKKREAGEDYDKSKTKRQ